MPEPKRLLPVSSCGPTTTMSRAGTTCQSQPEFHRVGSIVLLGSGPRGVFCASNSSTRRQSVISLLRGHIFFVRLYQTASRKMHPSSIPSTSMLPARQPPHHQNAARPPRKTICIKYVFHAARKDRVIEGPDSRCCKDRCSARTW